MRHSIAVPGSDYKPTWRQWNQIVKVIDDGVDGFNTCTNPKDHGLGCSEVDIVIVGVVLA